MEHMKLASGNTVAWGAVAASYATNILPWVQLLAAVCAAAASIATLVYVTKKAKKL